MAPRTVSKARYKKTQLKLVPFLFVAQKLYRSVRPASGYNKWWFQGLFSRPATAGSVPECTEYANL